MNRAILFCCILFLASCADTRHQVLVSVAQQRMAVIEDDRVIATFPVSTSRFGVGDEPNSYRTPLGKMKIADKIGQDLPLGMMLKDRSPTGEIVPVNAPGRDPIVTRILWLKGTEPQNASAHERCIYIHGTPEEAKLGTPASWGCVRMASKDIVWLFDLVGKGTRVEVLDGPLPQPAYAGQ